LIRRSQSGAITPASAAPLSSLKKLSANNLPSASRSLTHFGTIIDEYGQILIAEVILSDNDTVNVSELVKQPKTVSQDGRSVTVHDPSQVLDVLERSAEKKKFRKNPFSAFKVGKPVGNSAV